jgi:hypothetical protein
MRTAIAEVRKDIERLEYYRNSLDRVDGAEVRVRNIRIRKIKPITADVTLVFPDEGRKVTHRRCEYTTEGPLNTSQSMI